MERGFWFLGQVFIVPRQNAHSSVGCTNTTIKDSSPYDCICPEYCANGISLHDEPTNSIENWYPTYQTFAQGLEIFVGDTDYNDMSMQSVRDFSVKHDRCGFPLCPAVKKAGAWLPWQSFGLLGMILLRVTRFSFGCEVRGMKTFCLCIRAGDIPRVGNVFPVYGVGFSCPEFSHCRLAD